MYKINEKDTIDTCMQNFAQLNSKVYTSKYKIDGRNLQLIHHVK